MEITGKLKEVLPQITVGAASKTYQPLLVEVTSGNLTDEVYLTAWGNKVDDAAKLKAGSEFTFHVNIRSTKNPKGAGYFTNISVWKWTENA